MIALFLVSFACSTAPPQRDRQRFRDQLSREIEEMLRLSKRSVTQDRHHQASSEVDQLRAERPPAAILIPVAGVSADELRSTFGEPRSHGRAHMGIDIFAPRGTAVLAATGGLVKLLAYRELAGRCLWLESDRGDTFFYAHLDRWAPHLVEGQTVSPGDVLGYVGNTGNASDASPHLHFEIHQAGVSVDPYLVLVAPVRNTRMTETGFQRPLGRDHRQGAAPPAENASLPHP